MIEKNIFQSWCTTNLPPRVQAKIYNFRRLNPEYAYKLFTDADMDTFVNQYYPGEIASCYNRLNIIVAKVDFWRYLVLYKYGGVYLDMDSSIEIALHDLIKDEDTAVITAEGNPNLYVQWALIFAKEHPILKRTIELVVDNIKNNRFPNNILKMTGPYVYTRAIDEIHLEFFNAKIDHSSIHKGTDVTYKHAAAAVSYRLYGIDYSNCFQLKHEVAHLLYNKKKHWRVEEKEKQLLR